MPLMWDEHRGAAEELAERWKPSATGGDTAYSERYITALETVANIQLAIEMHKATVAMTETAKWTKHLAFFTAAAVLVGLFAAVVALWK